jgi:hypothetical protein
MMDAKRSSEAYGVTSKKTAFFRNKRIFLESRAQPVCEDDKFSAICGPIA